MLAKLLDAKERTAVVPLSVFSLLVAGEMPLKLGLPTAGCS